MISRQKLSLFPSSTGVYIFKETSIPIYIGKAINLKARLLSHIRCADFDNKEKLIITRADSIEVMPAISEFEALLLEAKLIKQFKPKYNRIWKDDKSYLYIKITIKHDYPKVFLVRRENDGQSLYFGPFQSTRTARYLLSEIRRIIPFCTQKKLTGQRCFYAKIGWCNPCPNYIESLIKKGQIDLAEKKRKEYQKNLKQIIMILNGQSLQLFKEKQNELENYLNMEQYEEALSARDLLFYLKRLVYERSIARGDSEYTPVSEKAVKTAIADFLKRNFSDFASKREYRIECYDVSNLFGRQATASLVVFKNGQSEKSQYRRFRIKFSRRSSDILALQEVLQRRFSRKGWPAPDLLVVDGGRPQLRALLAVLKRKGISTPLIGIAKNPDRIMVGSSFKMVKFAQNDPFFTLIRAIRDEAHRFARKYHLLLRNKKILL